MTPVSASLSRGSHLGSSRRICGPPEEGKIQCTLPRSTHAPTGRHRIDTTNS